MSIWPARDAELKELWPKHSMRQVAKIMGLTPGQVSGRSRLLNLQFHSNGTALELFDCHPAVVAGESLFQSRVQPAGEAVRILKPGSDNRKLGGRIQKGPWAGMPIFSLTLEERKTCPRDCAMFQGCYGNVMASARRLEHGPDLERRLDQELRHLARLNHTGFVVRLHILGDFYSVEYVKKWGRWLETIPQLRVWGYTARRPGTEIGDAIQALVRPRFMIRLSTTAPGRMAAITLAKDTPTPPETILCPAETGLGVSCGSCALCWAVPAMDKTIAFRLHGG